MLPKRQLTPSNYQAISTLLYKVTGYNIILRSRTFYFHCLRCTILTIDEEEEGSSFVSNSTGDQSFSSSRRSIQQNTTWRLVYTKGMVRASCWSTVSFNGSSTTKVFCPHLHTNGLEEGRVSEGELNHLFDLSQLLADSSDVIIADFIQRLLLILQTTKTQTRSSSSSIYIAIAYYSKLNRKYSVCNSACTGSIYWSV